MSKTSFKRAKRIDRVARWMITIGGAVIIVCIIAILILIMKVSFPLFQPADATLTDAIPLPGVGGTTPVVGVGIDDYRETAYWVGGDGRVGFIDLVNDCAAETVSIEPPAARSANGCDPLSLAVRSVEPMGFDRFGTLWSDGTLTLDEVAFTADFDKQSGTRTVSREVKRRAVFCLDPGDPVPLRSLAVEADGATALRVDVLPGRRLVVVRQETGDQPSGAAAGKRSRAVLEPALPGDVTAMALDGVGRYLYVATDSSLLLRWELGGSAGSRLLDEFRPFEDSRRITALGLVCGDMSLAVGDSAGEVTTWCAVPVEGQAGVKKLRRLHTLPLHDAPVVALFPTQRDKCLLSVDVRGGLILSHMTTERRLLSLSALRGVSGAGLARTGAAILVLDQQGGFQSWRVTNPHPEVSLRTLFSPVWYEGAPRPAYVWQSSSATDDTEPKMSVTPLVFGTIKGTFYAMLFSVPLALFGALYISQFTTHEVRRVVKPAIEIMAAVPSVILGFLAALWFAPLLERNLLAFFLAPLTIGVTLAGWLLLWQALKRFRFTRIVEHGYEFVLIVPVLLLGACVAGWLAPGIDHLLFGGQFKAWLVERLQLPYDLRNCVVIAFALGFAVIPIVFTLAEDSLSNVPYVFTAASLALGASRWQTVWRVILPSASPGIFAGIMIGFGRAIGETMIVLMATGNTPIMDWNVFNGMRTLSANIAVEIPEAPLNGTLYRVLFLSATLLFIMTFFLNTLAEVVRQRLRKKYGRY